MPEVAEVAHVVALLRRNVIGCSIKSLGLHNDPLLLPVLKNNPKAEQDLESMRSKLLNSTIISVGRHGKNFWLRLELSDKTSGVLAMHFGMTGMIKLRNVKSHLVFMEGGGDKKVLEKKNSTKIKTENVDALNNSNGIKEEQVGKEELNHQEDEKDEEDEEWPPKYSKFEMELVKADKKLEVSYVDPRRLGRIRLLVGCAVDNDEKLMQQDPFKKLGPDYSKDPQKKLSNSEFEFGDPDPDTHGRPRLSLEDFNKLILSKKKPIKALLQDQEYFAGIGNWVSDEVVYQARIHPSEVLSSKLPSLKQTEVVDPIIEKLYYAVINVCEESVKCEGDVTKFPENWLMLYRWGKARKKGPKAKTADGYEVDHITVGGRTSCFVPELQKLIQPKIGDTLEDKKDIVTKGKSVKRHKKD